MSVRRITRVAMGVALFTVLSLMLQVPVYQNYYVSLGYFVMAVWLYSFGVIDGTITGTLGVVLYCVITGGMRGMPGWTLGNFFIGLEIGCMFMGTKHLYEQYKEKNDKVGIAILSMIQSVFIIISVIIGILIVKSFTEVVLYAQPMLVRMATNTAATIADAITLILALPVAIFMDSILKKRFPQLIEAI